MSLPEETRRILEVVAKAASDKLGENPVAIDVRERMPFSDVFFVVSADSDRQVLAITDEIVDQMVEAGYHRPRVEGRDEATWVLLDCAGVIVHVMDDQQRSYYALERLWGDCPRLQLEGVA